MTLLTLPLKLIQAVISLKHILLVRGLSNIESAPLISIIKWINPRINRCKLNLLKLIGLSMEPVLQVQTQDKTSSALIRWLAHINQITTLNLHLSIH